MATTALITADEFERMPIGEQYELIRGELREVPPTGGRHGWMLTDLTLALGLFVKEHRLGRLYVDAGFVLAQDTVLGPDIAFVRAERLLSEEEQIGLLRQAPDLVLEIISPNDRASDVLEKVMLYLDAGVPLVWGLDPQRQRVMVWKGDRTVQELGPGDTLDGGDVLPGFGLAPADFFSD